ncbi:MAG: tryptophan--tRNA ligase [Clostridia bacterium]|nr:tryptophan--tRNA ligase [Clostridia bacterium]
MEDNKKVVFSGIQPSGSPTIGNYIGAIRNYVALQEEYECFYSVVDMHAITVRQNPAELRQATRNLIALLIACGLDPDKSTLYVQSHVPAHAELCWILNCFTYMGELSRMIQFKEKSKGNENSVVVGLLDYPVLQVADILLYQTDLVPIGADQKQHLEITRDVAIRFNNAFSPTFKVPEILIPEVGARIMSINDPTKKMSKSSDDPNSYILILDKPEDIKRKIKRAVTDSDNEIYFDEENKPGVSNLITIYSVMTGKTIDESVKDLSALGGYGAFKENVADAVIAALEPVQKRYNDLISDKGYIDSVMYNNAMKASYVANKTLSKVKRKVGFADLPRPKA